MLWLSPARGAAAAASESSTRAESWLGVGLALCPSQLLLVAPRVSQYLKGQGTGLEIL